MDSGYWIRTLTATPKRIYKCQPGMVPSINLVGFSYQYHQFTARVANNVYLVVHNWITVSSCIAWQYCFYNMASIMFGAYNNCMIWTKYFHSYLATLNLF